MDILIGMMAAGTPPVLLKRKKRRGLESGRKKPRVACLDTES